VLKLHDMKTNGGAEVKLHALLTLALDGGIGQFHALVTLPLWKEPRNLLDRRLGGPQSWCWTRLRREKFSGTTRNWTPVAQPVAKRYTDW